MLLLQSVSRACGVAAMMRPAAARCQAGTALVNKLAPITTTATGAPYGIDIAVKQVCRAQWPQCGNT